MTVRPITPEEAEVKRQEMLPGEVFEAFNEKIALNMRTGGYAKFKQEDVCRLLASKLDISTQKVYDRCLLDIEDIYRKAGWKVEYDKPGYNESYDAFFTFSKT